MKKRGAMELSVGTIVVIVLAMSMLILGLVLVKNIFGASNKIVSMTEDQLVSEVQQLFGAEKKLAIYPTNKQIDAKIGKKTGFGIAIKNKVQGGATPQKFSYEVVVNDPDIQTKCGFGPDTVKTWLIHGTGRAGSDIEIPPSEIKGEIVLFTVPEGTSLCTIRLGVTVKYGTSIYSSESVDVEIK